jgi:guanine nucleotide-binding protein subunit beta-2-like 1 protein
VELLFGILIWIHRDIHDLFKNKFCKGNNQIGVVDELCRHSSEVTDVKLSLDGKYFVTCSKDNQIFIWDVAQQKITQKLTGHSDEVLSVSISADSKMLVSGSKDKTLKFWDISNGKCTNTVKDADVVTSVCFSPNTQTNFVISGGYDKTVKRWDLSKFSTTHVATGHTDIIHSVSVSGDGLNVRLTVTYCNRLPMRLWRKR